MKKIIILISIACFLSACQKNYTDKDVQWGADTVTEENKKCLRENQIPFKDKGGKTYIPEDAFDIAINSCS
ncbi:lipoprotein [Bacillus swezeyi]|uniref:lipoprotein n=1 Tax=Bacillus swezeyi TaxID=1925020 RepID=UPI0027DC56C7|nr:hypothetical protein [Bacillus swezeyi]